MPFVGYVVLVIFRYFVKFKPESESVILRTVRLVLLRSRSPIRKIMIHRYNSAKLAS